MPKYTFIFDYNIGDKIYDRLTGLDAEVVGVCYLNGQDFENNDVKFHEDIYIIKFKKGYKYVRYSEQIEPF